MPFASRQLSLPPLVLLGALCLAPRTAGATAPGEWVVGLSPSYAFIVLKDQSEPAGGGTGLFAQFGLTDAFAVRLSGLWTGHRIAPTADSAGGLYQVLNCALGLQYSLDLLSVTPSIEVGGGVLHLRFGGQSATNLGLQLGVGVDYWVGDWLGVGAAFHYHAFLSNPAEYPVYFDAGPRVAIRWR